LAGQPLQPAVYRLLGVDPGTNILGFAVLEVRGKDLSVPEMGVLHLHQYDLHEERLQRIFERIQQIIQTYHPKEMAIEAPFYGKNAQSMLKLGRAQGVAIAAAMTNGAPIFEYSPKSIKQAVTGNGNAAKEQVASLLEHQLRIDLSGHLLDATDALATAFCHYLQGRHGRPAAAKGSKRADWGSFIKNNPDRLG
jgi:crossover junction endodeoxyribonuclease RuvC